MARKGNSRREIKDLFTVPDDHMSRSLLARTTRDANFSSLIEIIFKLSWRMTLYGAFLVFYLEIFPFSLRDVRVLTLSMMITAYVKNLGTFIIHIIYCLAFENRRRSNRSLTDVN